MHATREVRVLSMDTYRPVGIMATIAFIDEQVPQIGDVIEFEGVIYRIKGVVVSSSSQRIANNLDNEIYDCNLDRV